ncbi:MAG TPA: DUF3887 domain-containing protein [Pyrinomonadaceae bacterium]|nr:DUF3887 domain-containing protein [Pyrinomonadaceae bacterium]
MKNIIDKRLALFFLVALISLIASCSLMKSTKPSEIAVEKFHSQYNQKQFSEIYNQADEKFKNSATEEQFLALFENLYKKLGTVKQSSQVQWNVNATTSGTFVTLTYDVEFSEGKGMEQFVYLTNGDKSALYNYNVNSPLLIAK